MALQHSRTLQLTTLQLLVRGVNVRYRDVQHPLRSINPHHLVRITTLKGQKFARNPKTDLAVFCANCHRMIHRFSEPWNIAAFKEALQSEAACVRPTESEHSNRERLSAGPSNAPWWRLITGRGAAHTCNARLAFHFRFAFHKLSLQTVRATDYDSQMQLETKDWVTLIGVLVTLVVAMANLFYSIISNRRTNFINTVTASRMKWIDSLRDKVSAFIGVTTHISRGVAGPELPDFFRQKDTLQMQIELHLNPDDPVDFKRGASGSHGSR
jgi:hypothetical protein